MKIPKSDNKTTLITNNGYTDDIIKAVISVFNENWAQLSDFAKQFKGVNIRETANNIATYVVDNFNYVIDPNGEQWIRTPARLLSDREADCKSFSIFVCSCLSCLGIENGFRFVSYTNDLQLTHVYTVAEDEDGLEFIIDTVAQKQKGLPIFEEVKYKYKRDIMNTTRISKLSGFGDIDFDFVSGLNVNSATNSADLYIKSMMLKAILTRDQNTLDWLMVANWLLNSFSSERDLDLCSYLFAKYYSENIGSSINDVTIANTIKEKVRNYGLEQIEFEQTESYIITKNWFDRNITGQANLLLDSNLIDTINQLKDNAFNFLYLFADDRDLSYLQRDKKKNQYTLLQIVLQNTNITIETAKAIIFDSYIINYQCTPQMILNYWYPKIKVLDFVTTIGFGAIDFADDSINKDDLDRLFNETVNNKTNKNNIGDKINGWVNSAVDSFVKLWQTITGTRATNNPITPTQYDYQSESLTDSPFFWIAIVGGGYLIYKKSKKNKRKK